VLSPPAVGGAPGSVVVDGTGLRVLRPDPR
jgi:hypothetical protein